MLSIKREQLELFSKTKDQKVTKSVFYLAQIPTFVLTNYIFQTIHF